MNSDLVKEIQSILNRVTNSINQIQSEELKFKTQSPSKQQEPLNDFKPKTEHPTTPTPKSYSFKKPAKFNRQESRKVLKTPEKNIEQMFRPIINQRSQKLMKKFQNNSQNCWENLYEDSFCKKHKIDTARKQGIEKEFKNKDFTFHPLIISRNKSSLDLVTRTYSWLQQKNKKISLKVEEEAGKDLQGCTFMPEIHEFRDEGVVLRDIKGVDKFLGRKKVSRNEESPLKFVSKGKNISVKEYEDAVKDLSSYLHSIEITYQTFE